MITKYQLGLALPSAQTSGRLDQWYALLVGAMDRYEITTIDRFTFFLANVAEETGQLQARQENLNYSAERLIAVFPSLFSRDRQHAIDLAHQGPQAIANYVYADANRPDGHRMGNLLPGDGWRYRGRGPMQITGKTNYREFFRAVGLPDDSDPDLLLQPRYGALSAAEYWTRKGCNALADEGDFTQCVVRVNGGTTGLASRCVYLKRLQDAMAHPDPRPRRARMTSMQDDPEDAGDTGCQAPVGRDLEPIPPMSPVPPLGYVTTESGNVVRSDLSESVILRSARMGQRIAWGTGVVTGILTGLQALREAFVGMFAGLSPVLLLTLSAVGILLALCTFIYFRGIERRRAEMHKAGVA